MAAATLAALDHHAKRCGRGPVGINARVPRRKLNGKGAAKMFRAQRSLNDVSEAWRVFPPSPRGGSGVRAVLRAEVGRDAGPALGLALAAGRAARGARRARGATHARERAAAAAAPLDARGALGGKPWGARGLDCKRNLS